MHSASEQTFGEAVAAGMGPSEAGHIAENDWKHFNDVLGGLQRGCLYIIAARPGDGKTDFALHLAVQLPALPRGLQKPGNDEGAACAPRAVAGMHDQFHPLSGPRPGTKTRRSASALRRPGMGDLHLVMDDTPGVSAGDVEAKLASGKPDVMFIDYLGLMRGDAAGNKPLWQITGRSPTR